MSNIQTVTSITGSVHIATFNFNNSFCHHISVLQRLHTSKTLNECLANMQIDDKLIHHSHNINNVGEVLLSPLCVYSKINTLGPDFVYKAFKSYFEWFVKDYVAQDHGYVPTYLLYNFMMPCIHHLYRDKFAVICCELHLDPINFNKLGYVINDNYSHGYLKQEYNNIIKGWYNEMIKDINISPGPFVCTTLEIYTTANQHGGHAVTLLKGVNDYYVLDDDKCLCSLSEWYNTSRKERIYEVSMRDVDKQTADEIGKLLNAKGQLEGRVSRYVLNFGDNVAIGMSGGKAPSISPTVKFNGAGITDLYKPDKSMNMIMFMVFVLIIIIIICEISAMLPLKQTVEKYISLYKRK